MAEQRIPYVEITEQPQSKGFRFRYECEGKSHGGIQGSKSRKDKRTYPSIRLRNYHGSAKIVVSLVTDEDVPKPHVHKLVGKNCENGVYSVVIQGEEPVISFQNLGIKHTTKKNLVKTLQERLRESYKLNRTHHSLMSSYIDPSTIQLTDDEEEVIRKEAENLSKDMQLNVVKLQFQVCLVDDRNNPTCMLTPVYSNPIYDNKAPCTSLLKICRMDKVGGCCTGNEEVFLLCDKIQKEDVAIRFYEQNEDGIIVWEDFAQFSPQDVHRQFAIVFQTPPYLNKEITTPVTVHVQLMRNSDGETSDSKTFVYYPQEIGMNGIQNKRRKRPRFETQEPFPTAHVAYQDVAQGHRGIYGPPSGTGEDPFFFLSRGCPEAAKPGIRTIESTQTIPKKELQWLEKLEQLSDCLRMYSSTEDVRFLLSPLKALIKSQNEDGDNSIHLSVIHNKAMAAFNLLSTLNSSTKKYLAVDQTNNLKQTPVFLSVVSNGLVHLKMLLEGGCDVEQLTREGSTLLHVAAKLDRHESMDLLFAHSSASMKNIIDRFNYNGFTAVHEASKRGSLKCLRLLTEHGADIQLKDQLSGKTALHHAVEGNHLCVVAYLILETQIDVNLTAMNGVTALQMAVVAGDIQMTALLTSANAKMGTLEESPYVSDEESNDDSVDRLRSSMEDLENQISRCSLSDEIKKLLSGESYESVMRDGSDVTNIATSSISSIFCDSGIESLKKE